ncbi:hypothetical protein N7537_000779 [Penicillium hordei]|uniref:DUF7587 domain-containing protein n=1 Tax=Penicillium hordei TaxID=40994 RepID=A0AAD6EEB7_9EURO|nr:uncharacterized protein N7537_000779 [Penicillium hordei]KAJ5615665.1 hypothetical protein N7537_000779 [Penicillium hordei]
MEGKRPKLRWDVPMRQALCCLYRFFRCNKKQKEEIFFSMFRDNLRKRGIHRFVPGKTLHAQWNWMRNTGDLIWSHVHRNTDFNMDGEWRNVIQRIKSTALTMHLPLIEKTEDDIDTAQWGTRMTMALRLRTESPPQTPHPMSFSLHQRRAEERSHYFAKSDDQKSESITMSVGQSQEWADEPRHIDPLENNEAVVTSHGKTCIWCEHGLAIDETDGPDEWTQHTHLDQHKILDENQSQHQHQGYQDLGQQVQDQQPDQQQEHQGCSQQHHGQQGYHHDHELAMRGVPADKMPPLLFRWSNRDSQGVNSKTVFLAGLFCNGEWLDPEDLSDDRFESFFRSHVTKEKVKTPFISTSHSPLAPLHRAIANQNGAMLTVIDTSKLETKVFYAHPLAIRTRTFTYSWKGYGEYLIWGRIPLEAIGFSVEITSLEQIIQSHRDVARLMQTALIRGSPRCNQKLRDMLAAKRKSPFQSGRTLGKLLTLLEVPTVHWDNITSRFAKSWGWKYAKEIVLLHNGLRSAPPYLSEELSDSESEVPWPTPQKTPVKTSQKMPFSSDCVSDLDYEPSETDKGSGGTSESEYMDESRSMTICDVSETSDDGKFSTHETLSSGMFSENDAPEPSSGPVHSQEVIDLTSDNEDTSSQRALQLGWPSDDEYMYPDTPTKIRGRIPLQSGQSTINNLVLDGHTDMDFFEKVRTWAHHEN